MARYGLALSQRAQTKVDKYREGYAAQGLRHAFLPAIVSTSGRIHGELLRLLFNLADKKTSNSFEALGEAIDVESEVYCRRRSGNFWRCRRYRDASINRDSPQAQAGGSEGGQERSDSVSWEEGQPRSSRCDSVLKEFLYWGAPRCQHCHSDGAHYLARRSRSDGLSLTALT